MYHELRKQGTRSTFPKFESYRSVTTTNNNRHSGARVTREARDKRARNPYPPQGLWIPGLRSDRLSPAGTHPGMTNVGSNPIGSFSWNRSSRPRLDRPRSATRGGCRSFHASPNRVKRKINTLDQTDGFPPFAGSALRPATVTR